MQDNNNKIQIKVEVDDTDYNLNKLNQNFNTAI